MWFYCEKDIIFSPGFSDALPDISADSGCMEKDML